MINKAASKEYYIDANGFVKEVSGAAENLNKSSTYSSVLDRLIAGDNKVVIGVDDGWVSSGQNGLEANAFTGNNSGITIGDNGTPQVVVVSGKDMPNSSADITLAHELTHALRGEDGIKHKRIIKLILRRHINCNVYICLRVRNQKNKLKKAFIEIR